MTNEEAKQVFLNRGYVNGIFDGDKWRQSIVVVSKWLEQEPCEDCISRNKVLEGKVIHQTCDGVEIINSYAVPVEYIEQLSSIQPKPKADVLDKIRADVINIADDRRSISVRSVIKIIDKYKAESENKECINRY